MFYFLMHSEHVGTGVLFSGHLDPTPPLDQSARYSGYCAIRSRPKKVLSASLGVMTVATYLFKYKHGGANIIKVT